MQKDLSLGMEFRLLNLDMLEADTGFFRVYAELLYYNNKSLLKELEFHKSNTHLVLSDMQELVEESSFFVQVFFMGGFSEAKKQELELLDEMYEEAAQALG